MATSTISIRLPDDVLAELDTLAGAVRRNRNDLIAEAVREYVRREGWHLRRIQHSIAQADAGEFVPDGEMAAFWGDWAGTASERTGR
jgi:RHH-type rel operon transcriptional repressor/antitoxin RelB